MSFNSEEEYLRRRVQVADRYLKGMYQSQIAAELGVTQQCVSQDLAAIRAEWKESMLVDFNEAKAKELAKIDQLELTYREAWERSIKPVKKSRRKMKGRIDKERAADRQQASEFDTTDITEERQGNPRFLDGVMSCIMKRVAILGLDAPQKIELNEKNFPSWLKAVKPANLN